MPQTEIDQNLMIVAALEGYALKHRSDRTEVFSLFEEHNIFDKIRASYDVLHTQSIDESLAFAEDVLSQAV